MSRQQTANTFTEGMIMDLNPITTPNNVLTNALNATLITYNGNEFVLQNDMGNGRVETAYLPAGYVPVGIKEYGGIIYVASYNPLTNKGQLGSFPSPERNISSDELERAKVTISPGSFNYTAPNQLDQTIYKVNLFPKGTVLRSGDKFTILIDTNNAATLSSFISNYLNATTKSSGGVVTEGKPKSPKNKLLSITVAVLDANNNLRDITEQLKRFDTNSKVIEFDASVAPLVKSNAGYYIQAMNTSESTDLEEFRKRHAVNTYNNKVFGNIYLITTLNTIESIDVSTYGFRNTTDEDVDLPNLEGVKVPKQSVSVVFDVNYKYNCPDGIYDVIPEELKRPSNYNEVIGLYETYYGTGSDFASSGFNSSNVINGVQIDTTRTNSSPKGYTLPFKEDTIENYPIYDIAKKIYTREQNAKLDLPLISSDSDDVLNYVVTPCMTYTKLPGLQVNGSINLDKLGTGEVNVNAWRYFCNQDSIVITWGFEAYPLAGTVIDSVVFEFYDIFTGTKVLDYEVPKKRSYNGTFTDTITFDSIVPKKLYLVKIAYSLDVNRTEEGDGEYTTVGYRWLFTTPLYNEYYFSETYDFNNFDTTDPDFNKLALKVDMKNTLLSRIATPETLSTEEFTSANEKHIFDIYKHAGGRYTYDLASTIGLENGDNYPFELNQSNVKNTKKLDEAKMAVPEVFNVGPLSVVNIPNYDTDKFVVDKESEIEKSDSINLEDFSKQQFTAKVTGDNLDIEALTISRIYAENKIVKDAIFTNPYTPFIEKGNESKFNKVFGFEEINDGGLLSVKEVGFSCYDKRTTEREKINYIVRSAKRTKRGEQCDENAWQIKEKDNLYVKNFRNELLGVINAKIGSPICAIVGNAGEIGNVKSVFTNSDNDYTSLVANIQCCTNQILMWWDGSNYIWVEDFIYGSGDIASVEMAEIVYQTFKDVLIQQGETATNIFYAIDVAQYTYNNKFTAVITSRLANEISFINQNKKLISETLDYNDSNLETWIKRVVTDIDDAAEIISHLKDLATFKLEEDIVYSTITTEVTVPDMSDVYGRMVQAASDATNDIVAITEGGSISREDASGNKFVTGQIYYRESDGSIKLIQSSTGKDIVKNLKYSNNTLIVKSATKKSKWARIRRSGDATWLFEGLPVVDIALKKITTGNTRWATLSK